MVAEHRCTQVDPDGFLVALERKHRQQPVRVQDER
jgi:hypothetical protein